MRILNLGILAHVDAGKTSLTERLLFEAGVTDRPGSVDAGTTRTDSLDLERRRGITIKSAVVSFTLREPGGDDLVVNLVDTPGHPDFIAEVERVLDVLDAVVLVVSAVEGVQPQTRVLTRALRRRRLPILLFVNKIDRMGARPEAVAEDVRRRLGLHPVRLGSVRDAGTRQARVRPDRPGEVSVQEAWAAELAEADDDLLGAWLDHRLAPDRLDEALRRQTVAGQVHPLLFGSAITGAGVPQLRRALVHLAPPALAGADHEPLRARVFAVQRDPDRRRVVLARVLSGTLSVRDRVHVGQQPAKITGLELVDDGSSTVAEAVPPGRIARLRGLPTARVGDLITAEPAAPDDHVRAFAPPALETVIHPRRPGAGAALHTALTELAEQDPLINFRLGPDGAPALSLYGEVQKEVIAAVIADEYGIETSFDPTSPICVERVIGSGEGVARLSDDDNPFLAGVGLAVSAAAPGSGLSYAVDSLLLGTLPPAFFVAIEETVHTTMQQGLSGWQVIDARVTLTHTGYYPRQSHAHATFDKSMSSTAGDFRLLTPLVLMTALWQACTRVLEPVHRFTLDLPESAIRAALGLVTEHGGLPQPPAPSGGDWQLRGEVPAAAIHRIQQRLPGLTGGEGAWESDFAGYRPVTGRPPTRARTDADPLDRKAYLLRVQRRQL